MATCVGPQGPVDRSSSVQARRRGGRVGWLARLGMLALLGSLAALGPPWATAEPPQELTPEQQALRKRGAELNAEAIALWEKGRPAAAVTIMRRALAVTEELYPKSKYVHGHPDVAPVSPTSVACSGMPVPTR